MTTEELKAEWLHTKINRLGNLCADQIPTPSQIDVAEKEADEHIEELKKL